MLKRKLSFHIIVEKVTKLLVSPQMIFRSSYKNMLKAIFLQKKSFFIILERHTVWTFVAVQNGRC